MDFIDTQQMVSFEKKYKFAELLKFAENIKNKKKKSSQ